MKRKVFILNGPNLNMLGIREPEIYGHETLKDIEKMCAKRADELGLEIDFRQSNHEGELVDWIQEGFNGCDGIIINPAAYTHTSVAILDALKAIKLPIIEVHLSDIEDREDFRKHSYVSLIKDVITITGKKSAGYIEAIENMDSIFAQNPQIRVRNNSKTDNVPRYIPGV